MTGLCCEARAIEEIRSSTSSIPGMDGRLGRRVLGRLGLDVDLAPSRIATTYRTFFPEAVGIGYWRCLRAAIERDGQLASDPQRELDWLAAHIRIAAPSGTLPAWTSIWRRAESIAQLGIRVPKELGTRAKRHLVGALASTASYSDLVVDALAAAMAIEARTG